MPSLSIAGFILLATVLEAGGDAIVRLGLGQTALLPRGLLFAAGAVLLFCYGLSLNLAPIEFGRVIGVYIATLFVVWQIIAVLTFKTVPDVPTLAGGGLVVAGGLVVSLWPR